MNQCPFCGESAYLELTIQKSKHTYSVSCMNSNCISQISNTIDDQRDDKEQAYVLPTLW